MRYKRYEKYKDSGVEWIGEIPEHWEVKKIKNIGLLSAGGVNKKIEDGQEICKSVHYMDVYKNSGSSIGNNDDYLVVSATQSQAKNCTLKKGDVLFTSSSETPADIGHSVTISEDLKDTLYGYHLMRLRLDAGIEVDYSYRKYMFNNHNIRCFFASRAVGITRYGLNYDDYKDAIVFIPPLKEQIVIAHLIDQRTTEIDSLIADKEKMIQLLQEKRQAIISEAVTKGLDRNVPMKDSGVEWIGEIPEHWQIVKLKFISNIKYGLGQPPKELEGGIPLIRATNIQRGKIVETDLICVDPDDVPYERDPVLKQNDIIVVRSGAYTGDSAIITEKYAGAIAGYDMVVRIGRAFPEFIAYALLSKYVLNDQLYLQRLRAAQPHLNAEELGNTLFVLPKDIKEQENIAAFLNKRISQIDNIIFDIQVQIDKLKEYRQSLISEAVTGKIDVRDFTPFTEGVVVNA